MTIVETLLNILALPWLIWLIGLVIGLPIAMLMTGWVIKRRDAAGKPARAPRIMRNFVLPTASFYLLVRYVLQFGNDSFVAKAAETVLSIFLLVFLFNAINFLFFSEYNILTRKETIPKLGRDVLNFVLTLIFGSVVLSSVWGFELGNLLTALGVS